MLSHFLMHGGSDPLPPSSTDDDTQPTSTGFGAYGPNERGTGDQLPGDPTAEHATAATAVASSEAESGSAFNSSQGIPVPPFGGKPGANLRRIRTGAGAKASSQTWLKIDQFGNTSYVSTDRHKLAIKLGVQLRDLRLLDAAMASVSPPAILDRERAIVVNLQMVKCIITLEYVLVVNPDDEAAQGFIDTLKDKLSHPMYVGKVVSYPCLSRISSVKRRLTTDPSHNPSHTSTSTASQSPSFTSGTGSSTVGLSFELKVLEICLDCVVGALDQDAKELDHIIVPTIDSLTKKVKHQDLDILRRGKNRLAYLTNRIETVKEVLERFLEDDEDMHKLNLTAQELYRQAMLQELTAQGDGTMTPRTASRVLSRRASLRRQSSATSSVSSRSGAGAGGYLEDDADVAEVEMLLEAYQMHLDHLYNKLQTLEQFVEDSEDLVNVSLDTHRNRIIATDLFLTAFYTALGLGTSVSGIFGMNITYHNLIPDYEENDNPWIFNRIAIFGGVIAPFIVMGGIVLYAVLSGAIRVR